MNYPRYGKIYLEVAPTRTIYHHDDYWKPKAPDLTLTANRLKIILKERGYAVSATTKKDSQRHSLLRSDMGLISYLPYSNNELRGFVKARGIDTSDVFSGKARKSRAQLLGILDEADQKPKFRDFLSLPAEIRNTIYQMHIDGVNEPESTPSQPPITLVNRQVRSETLEMFYSSITVPVKYVRPRDCETYVRPLQMWQDTISFFRGISKANLAAIRRFRFSVTQDPNRSYLAMEGMYAQAWFEIDLPQDGAGPMGLRFPRGPETKVQHVWKRRIQKDVPTIVRYMNHTKCREVDLDFVLRLRRKIEFVW